MLVAAADVELMARVMRKFDLDGNIDPKAAELGELIIKAGMAYFPNDPNIQVLYAVVLLDLKHDGPLARSHLKVRRALRGLPADPQQN
ncbi:hypothetical protein DUNSADRAFT_4177 [Dunaliella salina]|uniref:Uncharacterized protein n=1 Tax=Dunaliella salina TaxID=3046 RepID=A0ABQ7FUX1_DUNSA|nr:hypothetical protein DUNSADRAFT_4177 [Dunaliella salina]|eukprot:KAF5826203.1 hypothetical protein DUNSADRAFT_4177 [Dunaliella salina]